jgi:hypothetical protein
MCSLQVTGCLKKENTLIKTTYAYLVASARPNRLWIATISQVLRPSYAQILR